MTKLFRKGRRVMFKQDIADKNIYKYFKGEIINEGNPIDVFIFKLDKIVRFNQHEMSSMEVYDV